MKFKNEGDNDIYVFKLHFAAGSTVDVSTKDPNKLAWLRSNFTEVKDEPKPKPVVKAEPVPVPEVEAEPTKKRRPYKRRG
jgi:hypothetical protein